MLNLPIPSSPEAAIIASTIAVIVYAACIFGAVRNWLKNRRLWLLPWSMTDAPEAEDETEETPKQRKYRGKAR